MMSTICQYLCCCCCPSDGEMNLNKKNKDLQTLNEITPPTAGVWAKTSKTDNIDTENMTEKFEIPSPGFKNEMDVFQHLHYRIIKQIDSGSFGVILIASHIPTKLKVAVKKIVIPEALDSNLKNKREEMLSDVKNELFVLQKIRHPHIVKLIQHLMIKAKYVSSLYILMQFAENGNLDKYVESNEQITENQCKLWFAQILNGMSYMHSRGIAHRDLKLANILIDAAFDVLIADFGLSKIVWRKSQKQILMSSTYCGTPPYMAPEVLNIEVNRLVEYDAFAADVWSLGVILFLLYWKAFPFPKKPKKAIKLMRKKVLVFPNERPSSPQLQTLLRATFEPNPSLRPKMKRLQQFSWIQIVYKEVELKSNQKLEENN